MNIGQLKIEATNKKHEDDKHIKFTIELLQSENASIERVKKIMANELAYIDKYCSGMSKCGHRASKIVYQACEYLLNHTQLIA